MLALQAVTPARLAGELGVSLPEARRIVSAVHRNRGLDRVEGLRREARERAKTDGYVPSLAVRTVLPSAIDPFVKLVLGTADDRVIEAVRIPLERAGRFSACVSSQAGCALACAFCATGRLGLGRNLQTWEIVEQVRLLRATLGAGQRIHGVVFQGMGEPLANVDRVLEAIAVLCEPCALAIDSRAITVCTAGLPTGIRRLARDAPKVRLGLSIGSARAGVRRSLMPIEGTHPLDEVLDAAEEHARTTGLAPMWAVTPLAGVNDTDDDAAALAAAARGFEARSGIRPRLSVVPYNAIGTRAGPVGSGEVGADGADGSGEVGTDEPFARGDVAAFVQRLLAHGLRPHVRYSGGADVAAACGQLAGRVAASA